MRILGLLVFFISVGAHAAVEHFSFSAQDVSVTKSTRGEGFTSINVNGFQNSNNVGAPELPVKSMLLIGRPETITAKVDVLGTRHLVNTKPAPVQAQVCRCAVDQQRKFEYNESAYRASGEKNYELTYLGAFRGTPVTRLDVKLARYNALDNSVDMFDNVRVSQNAQEYSFERGTYTDYLIVVPAALATGIQKFVDFKKSQGYNVIVETVQTPQLTVDGIGKLIAQHYKNDGTDFVLLIGDENTLPMHSESTSGGTTPSDLHYYTMDGADDTIPDMFYGRIAVSTAADATDRLAKTIEFDQKSYKDNKGAQNIVGISSDEGSGPSDDEYITSIEQKLASAYGYQITHLHQDEQDSNPDTLNNALDSGVAWMFYVGHGSGYSWPSMTVEYDKSDVSNIVNRDEVKPVIIDVACQNGRLLPNYLGTTFTDVLKGDAFGSAAYYGGTVNVSWHPPALMARGVAFEHAAKNFTHLGEALLAGQMYLAANWTDKDDVLDNAKWYILQGDPSMNIHH